MEEYYRSEISGIRGAEKSHRSSWVMRFLDGVAALFTWLLTLLLFLTLYAPVKAPTGWFFPVIGLLAPVTYIGLVLLLLYWVIRWRLLWLFFTAIPVVVGLFSLDLYLNLDFRSGRAKEPKRRGEIKLVCYNVRQFYGSHEEWSRDSLLGWVVREDPDIICMQEFTPRTAGGTLEQIDSILNQEFTLTTGHVECQNAIYSRYPILRSGTTCENVHEIRSVWADLLIKGDTIRVFNNHMQNTAITREDGHFLSGNQFLQDSAREDRLRSIVRRLGENSILRAAEADSIRLAVEGSPYRTIVCGDFNDVPFSYSYRTLSRGMQDAFSEVGKGYSYTYRGFRNLLRIDYVLCDPRIELLSYREDTISYSDHRPLVVRFALPKEP